MFSQIESTLLQLAHQLPLEWFALIASFIEEVIAPIPAVAVLLTTGSIAALQDRTILELFPLILLATVGKTAGAVLVYFVSARIGGVLVSRFGKFFEVTSSDIENLRSKIKGGVKDYIILTIARAAPVVPSSVVSIGSGLLEIKFRVYLVSTIIGTVIRDSFFLYVGYTGTAFLTTLATDSEDISSLVQNGLIIILSIGFIYYLYQRKKNYRKLETK